MLNKTQEEITAKWKNMDSDYPLVSIKCLAFNQEEYIAQTLDGFLMQETDFPFEAIVHDDASTDKTADIIREYQKKYPLIIKPILQTENQYCKRDGSLTRAANAPLKGKYVGVCEGDDYWTDSKKLQRQIDFLESHPDYSLSTENAITLFSNGVARPFSTEEEHDVSLDDLLIRRRFPTASAVYPRRFLADFEKGDYPMFDTSLWAFLATKGKVHFNPVISSVYRRGCGVTEANKVKWAFTSEQFNKDINKYYTPSSIVKKARKKTLFLDYKNGWKAAQKQGCKKDAARLLSRMIFRTPILFIKDAIKNKGSFYKKVFITKFWNIYYKVVPAKKLKISQNRKIPVVVSLTSFPARFETLHICLKSILNQRMQPDKIVLYLDKFVSLNNLPAKLRNLQKKGIIIRNICEDIKPHNKYFYAMQEHPEAAIITIDDDVIYAKDTILSLYKSFLKNPKSVSARRVHQITRNINGESMPYNTWPRETKNSDNNTIATGIGGVLYPPKLFDFSKPYLQISIIQEQCLKADDIWLAFMEKLNDIPVCYVPNKLPHPYKIISAVLKETALQNQNVAEKQNDRYIQNCRIFFGIDL